MRSDRNALAVALVIKPRPVLLDVDDVDRPHAQHFLGQQKIRQRLLMLRIDLHQNHIFRIMRSDNRAAQKFAVGSQSLVRSRNT